MAMSRRFPIVIALSSLLACDNGIDSSRAAAYAACRGKLAVATTKADSAAVFREGAGWSSPGGYDCARMVGEDLARRTGR